MKRKIITAAIVAIVLAASATLAVYISQRNSSQPPVIGRGMLDMRLEQMGQPPTGPVDNLTVQSQAPDHC